MEGNIELVIKLAELFALIGGGGIFIFKMGRAVSKFEEVGKNQHEDISEIKTEMKAMTKIMTKQALIDERIAALSVRMTLLDKSVDELRHGEGFIYPLGSKLTP